MNMGTDRLSVSFTKLPRREQVEGLTSFEHIRDISPGYQYGISCLRCAMEVSMVGAVTQVVYAEQGLLRNFCFFWQTGMPLKEDKH